MLATDFDNALETARNEYSCALACVVSLSRAIGRPVTQTETIAALTEKIPSWRERPGALSLEMMINLMMGTLETTAHIITVDPKTVLRYWNKPERLGGVVVSGRQPVKTGTDLRQNHAWRLMNCDEQQLVLMNPKTSGATIETVRWDFLTAWKGYFVLLESAPI
jgi:hypothetical protein